MGAALWEYKNENAWYFKPRISKLTQQKEIQWYNKPLQLFVEKCQFFNQNYN